jgi:hypothetical protein
MSLRTLRLSYRLLRIAALEDRIQLLAKKYPKEPEDRIRQLLTHDPSNGQFLEWLIRQDLNPGIHLDDRNIQFVRKILEAYTKIKKSPVLMEHYDLGPDISKYDVIQLENKLYKVLYGKQDLISQSEKIKKAKTHGSRLIYDKDNIRIIQIGGDGLDPDHAQEAACMYAKGTKWCTSDPNNAREYLNKRNLYVVFRGSEKVMQTDLVSFMTPEDTRINFYENEDLLISLLDSGVLDPSKLGRGKSMFDVLWSWMELDLTRLPYLTEYLINHEMIERRELRWFMEVRGIKNRWPIVEPYMAQTAEDAYRYADVIDQPFPLGEPAILTSPDYACRYAIDIKHGNWPEAIPVIQRDPDSWRRYKESLQRIHKYLDTVGT